MTQVCAGWVWVGGGGVGWGVGHLGRPWGGRQQGVDSEHNCGDVRGGAVLSAPPSICPPPFLPAAVYLSNMSVDAKLRRRGLARRMLAAAEALVASVGQREICLHARLADAPAQQLYLSSGFEVLSRDNALVAKVGGPGVPRAREGWSCHAVGCSCGRRIGRALVGLRARADAQKRAECLWLPAVPEPLSSRCPASRPCR